MLAFRIVVEVECLSMAHLSYQTMVHSFSKRNDVRVNLPHQGWLCTQWLVPPRSLPHTRFVGRFRMVYVDQRNWMSVDRFRVVRFVLGSTVASCNDSCIIDSSGDRLWLLDWDRVKALPSSREEFQFNWKSTGTRALPICTSRSLTIPPEFFWEQSTKVNNSYEGSTCRPRWSAITLGRMLTDAPVSYKACGNSIPCSVHGIANYPGSLFFFNVILLLIVSLASQNMRATEWLGRLLRSDRPDGLVGCYVATEWLGRLLRSD
ncbi:hypothetical protein DY000_02040353 [Brassica cretica]|uniref:DUF1618 domain-containing protein n=1 Tax=Brassica cretica TaxID=69181 RepID=A0ABQ7BQL9_BRACR|nr:hypothetical protein DY000_02040353 [Brassica cretica]